ncbi:hypothetical protein GWN26_12370 [Candidatus Saccharibacteria bacterium]|nr:hypothetical protein [Candidatus Saccharibacteria bacterium]NIW80225.1 hypothetical protein [Calditrichia bacterium]
MSLNQDFELEESPEEDEYDNRKDFGKKQFGKSFLLLANIVAGALVFGQLLEPDINWPAFIIGAIATIFFYTSAFIIFKKSKLI